MENSSAEKKEQCRSMNGERGFELSLLISDKHVRSTGDEKFIAFEESDNAHHHYLSVYSLSVYESIFTVWLFTNKKQNIVT